MKYLAGLIDGDGTIPLYKYEERKGKYLTMRYNARLAIYSIKREFLDKVREKYGGTIRLSRKAFDNRKDYYILYWSQNAMREMLPKLVPHLILKKARAKMAIAFLKLVGEPLARKNNGRWHRPDHISQALDNILTARNAA